MGVECSDGRRAKVRIEIRPVYPDWEIVVYEGREWKLRGFYASLAAGLVDAYERIMDIYDIPTSYDGCPEHHPDVRKIYGKGDAP